MPSKFCQLLSSEAVAEDTPLKARDGPGGGGGDVAFFRRLGVDVVPFSSMMLTTRVPVADSGFTLVVYWCYISTFFWNLNRN